jgi:hypothetical protein
VPTSDSGRLTQMDRGISLQVSIAHHKNDDVLA